MTKIEVIALKALGSRSLMDGREPIKTDEIIAKYPEGISITGIGKNTYNGDTYPVFTFAEEPTRYFSGGMSLSRLADGMFEEYDGDLAELNKDLQESPLRVKLSKVKTKRGYNFTKVSLLPFKNFEI